MSVQTVALKLPTFWTSCPAAWFAQTEAQFALRQITTDETKYFHVVAALDSDTAARSLPIISAPPKVNKYHELKNFLMSTFGLTETERADTLLNINGLGDRKPSELMDSMLVLLGQHKPCILFRQLFLRQLPKSVRLAITNSAHGEDYRALAQEADNLFNALNSTTFSASVAQTSTPTPTGNHTCWDENNEMNSICYYHRRFGSKARKCSESCEHFKNFKTVVNRNNTNNSNGRRNQGNWKAGQQ